MKEDSLSNKIIYEKIKKNENRKDFIIEDIKKNKEALKLINECFKGETENQYLNTDFPAWNINNGEVKFFATEIKDKTVSLCGLLETQYLYRGIKIKIGLIGSVCTALEYRGQGYATESVQKAIEYSKSRNLSALFLWGSEYNFYKKFGFELCGEQIRFYLKSLQFSDKYLLANHEEFSFDFTDDIEKIMRIRDEGVLWSEARYKTLQHQKTTQWVVLRRNKKMVAYCGYHRGMDLKDIVHEWYGETKEDLLKIFYFLSKKNINIQIIGSKKLLDQYSFYSDAYIEENLCMGLVLEPYSLMKFSEKNIKIGFIKNKSEEWTVTDFLTQSVCRVSSQQLAQIFFNQNQNKNNKIKIFSDFPVINLWFWGLDSL